MLQGKLAAAPFWAADHLTNSFKRVQNQGCVQECLKVGAARDVITVPNEAVWPGTNLFYLSKYASVVSDIYWGVRGKRRGRERHR